MHLNIWDYLTFHSFIIIGVGFIVALVLLMGLPGKIAYARSHPDADAVNVMGWVGFLAIVPWIHVFIWAFKPTDIVDIRKGPMLPSGDLPRLNPPPDAPQGQFAVQIRLDDPDQTKFPIGPQGAAAICTNGLTGGWAALRRIGIRGLTWLMWLHPLNI